MQARTHRLKTTRMMKKRTVRTVVGEDVAEDGVEDGAEVEDAANVSGEKGHLKTDLH